MYAGWSVVVRQARCVAAFLSSAKRCPRSASFRGPKSWRSGEGGDKFGAIGMRGSWYIFLFGRNFWNRLFNFLNVSTYRHELFGGSLCPRTPLTRLLHSPQKTLAITNRTSLRTEFLLPHPPYNPDLAPSDLYLLGPPKEALRGCRFADDNDQLNTQLAWRALVYRQRVFRYRHTARHAKVEKVCW